MQTKGHVVIEHSDGEVLGVSIFTGPNSLKEAREHFVRLVFEDQRRMFPNENDKPGTTFDAKEAMRFAKQSLKETKGNYTSDDDDFDIMIVAGTMPKAPHRNALQNPVRIRQMGSKWVVENEAGETLAIGSKPDCEKWCRKNNCAPIPGTWKDFNIKGYGK